MKKTNALCGILSSVLLLSQTVLVSHADAQQLAANASAPFVLQDGTPVRLRLAQTESSADAHVNDRVEFEVLEDVSVNNVVLIRRRERLEQAEIDGRSIQARTQRYETFMTLAEFHHSAPKIQCGNY